MDPSYSLSEWHLNVLPRATEKALEYLSHAEWLKGSDWYLAGGTAMALQAGHRSSVDLDFFTQKKEFSEESMAGLFSEEKEWKTDIIRKGTVYGTLFKAKTSFIAYPFFAPRNPYKSYGTISVLDIDDIAVMKIIAVSQRGRKRDFVDLYWYCVNRKPLSEIIRRLPDQYPDVAHNYGHILKSLSYFDDAEEDPMPKLLFKATWSEIKKFFKQEVAKTAREVLGL